MSTTIPHCSCFRLGSTCHCTPVPPDPDLPVLRSMIADGWGQVAVSHALWGVRSDYMAEWFEAETRRRFTDWRGVPS